MQFQESRDKSGRTKLSDDSVALVMEAGMNDVITNLLYSGTVELRYLIPDLEVKIAKNLFKSRQDFFHGKKINI